MPPVFRQMGWGGLVLPLTAGFRGTASNMQPNIPFAIGAGLASAVALTLVARVPAAAAPLLFLIGFPTAFAGLASNALTALAAAVVASLLLGAVVGLPAALAFAGFVGLPMTLLVHRALLHRDLADGATQWYPAGRLLLAASLIGGGVSCAALLLASGGDVEVLKSSLRHAVDRTFEAGFNAGTPMSAEQKAQVAEVMYSLLPGATAVVAALSLIVNLWLAGHAALRTRQLARPWPDLAAIQLPGGSSLLLAAAIGGGMLLEGLARLAAWGFAGALFFAYVLVGLAIVHHVTRGFPWRSIALAVLYGSLLLFSGVACLLLAVTGLADGFMHFRRPPATP